VFRTGLHMLIPNLFMSGRIGHAVPRYSLRTFFLFDPVEVGSCTRRGCVVVWVPLEFVRNSWGKGFLTFELDRGFSIVLDINVAIFDQIPMIVQIFVYLDYADRDR